MIQTSVAQDQTIEEREVLAYVRGFYGGLQRA